MKLIRLYTANPLEYTLDATQGSRLDLNRIPNMNTNELSPCSPAPVRAGRAAPITVGPTPDFEVVYKQSVFQ